MNCLFSVVIPFYKVSFQLLDECLASVASQTYCDFEVIIINDGDPGFPKNILDKRKNLDLKYIYQDNSGVSVARNKGIEAAKGKYIIFLDADDKLAHNTLEVLQKEIQDGFGEVYIGRYISNIETVDRAAPSKPVEVKKEDLISCIISHEDDFPGYAIGGPWGKAFKKEFLKNNQIRFIPGVKKCQDRLFMMECIEKAHNISFVNKVIYVYTMDNPTSVCVRYNNEIDKILYSVLMYTEKFIKNYYPTDKKLGYAFGQMHVNFIIVILKLKYLNRNRKISWIKRVREFKAFCKRFNARYYVSNYEITGITIKWRIIFCLIKMVG